MSYDDRLDALRLDVDMRIREAWDYAFAVDDDCGWDIEIVGELMRMSYGLGYIHALTEPTPALLHREHGYQIPMRRGH